MAKKTASIRFPGEDVPAGSFWAKSSQDSWHPLIAHSADVAAVMEALLTHSIVARRLAALGGTRALLPEQIATLSYLAALHDVGKINQGFQRQGAPGRSGPVCSPGHTAVVLSSLCESGPPGKVAVTDALLEALKRAGLTGRSGTQVLALILGHHGRPLRSDGALPRDELWASGEWGDPAAEVRRIATAAAGWVSLPETQAEPVRWTAEFTHLFAGVLTLADWVGSNEGVFSPTPEADLDPDAYWRHARMHADRALRQIGLTPHAPAPFSDGDLLPSLFPDTFPAHDPTPLQAEITTMPLPPAGSRVLIESETGSGKTEAALALYARLRAAGQTDGLMFALPTRATATAMAARVASAVSRLYPHTEHGPLQPVVAVGGRRDVLIEDPSGESSKEDGGSMCQWAGERAKTFLAGEIVVGTVDQCLLAGLPVRHANMRLAALSRHVLVVDEVHSYDRYMATILNSVLDLHNAAGGTVILMSATLSSAERGRFCPRSEEAAGEKVEAARPYPAVWVAEPRSEWNVRPVGTFAGAAKTVVTEVVDDKTAWREALVAAEAGARVGIIRNTVRGVRGASAALAPSGRLWVPHGRVHAPSYHSRFAEPDRSALDRAVIAEFGGAEPTAGAILVASQVAEQSLDIDFDLLISDLAPVDVLLQRVGRLHRHPWRRRQHAYTHPRLLVICPADGMASYREAGMGPPGSGWGTNPKTGGGVYHDLLDLHLTWQLLRDEGPFTIPADNRSMIEAVYHPDRRDALAIQGWEAVRTRADGVRLGQASMGVLTRIDFSRAYQDSFAAFGSDGASVNARTRLGDDTIAVPLADPCPAWYAEGASVKEAHVPFYVFARSELDPQDPSPLPRLDGDHPGWKAGNLALEYRPDGWHW